MRDRSRRRRISRRAGRPGSTELLHEAFELLGSEVVIAHAKDVRTSGEVVAAGKGDLDYELYLEHLIEASFDGPLILHGLGEEEVEGSATFLRGKLTEIGARH